VAFNSTTLDIDGNIIAVASYEGSSSGVTASLADPGQNTGAAAGDVYLNIEGLIGSTSADVLIGDDKANLIQGGNGSDSLDGGKGFDSLIGGAGNDTIDGGADDDALDGSEGIDTVSYASAGAGVTINLAMSDQNTVGSHTDVLRNFENITGSNFNDSLIGSSTDNLITGGEGDDTLDGAAGSDTLDGGNGSDTASYASASAAVTVSLGMTGSQITGGGGTDKLISIENLTGSGSNDKLTGSSTDNVMMGGVGNDTIDGGAGSDTVSYASATGSVSVNLLSQSSTGSAGNDTLYNIENVIGSASNDKLTGNNSNNVIIGGDGNDTLDGGAGNDTASYINATASVTVSLAVVSQQDTRGAGSDTLTNIENLTGSGFNDTLTGNSSNNYISGGDGADTLNVTSGNDTLDGGAGIDTVSFISQTTAVTVGLNIDTSQITGGYLTLINIENLTSTNHNDRLTGSVGDNIILGGAGNDTINGFWGNDTIDGGLGNDNLDGHDDNDTVSYASFTGAVTVSLDNDQPQNTGSAGTDTLINFENLTGSGSNDRLTGSGQDNVITGGAGNDTIIGGAGNDTLIGAAGVDSIDGGMGNDTVIWRIGNGNDTVSLGIGRNTLDLEGWAGGSVTSGAFSGAWSVAIASTTATFTRANNGGTVTVNDWTTGSNSVVCILPGTRITTPDGHRPIETLTPGDIVTTPDGPRPIRWVGRSSHSMVFLRGKPMCLPIRIHAGALGEGLPLRDLWVSPWHALLFGQTLVRAFDLTNGQNVTQDYQGQIACFYNVELDSPDIIFAEGAPVETYANHNNRAMFHNLDEYLALYGSHEPSWVNANGTGIRRHPLLAENAPELAPIRQALLARARKAAA
jgi:Ca2+-binding RTX toxin-like protein